MVDIEGSFLKLLLAPQVEQRGADKWNPVQVNFPFLKILFANFQINPFSHLTGYLINIYIYAYIIYICIAESTVVLLK